MTALIRSPRRRSGVLVLLALLLTFAVAAPSARALDGEWMIRHPNPPEISVVTAVLEAGERVRAYGGNALLESTDGTTWTATPLQPALEIRGVARGPGGYVASDGRGLHSSADGINWTQQVSGYYHVKYLGGRYVAVGEGGILTSDDGETWTRVYRRPAYDIAYGDGRYVARATDRAVYVSDDGVTWTRHETLYEPLEAIEYGHGLWVGFHYRRTYFEVSTDGITWKQVEVGARPDSIAYGDGRFVAVAIRDSKRVVLVSTDAVTWTEQPIPADWSWFELRGYADGYFVGSGARGWYRSKNGVTWTELASWHRGVMTSAAYGQGRWVATGQVGVLLSSPDGVNWTERELGTRGDMTAVIYTAGRFVAVGDEGIWTSPTGLTWTRVSDGRGFTTVAYGGGRFVALGNAEAWSSADGLSWVKQQAPEGVVSKVTYGNGRFVAVGSPTAAAGGYPYGYAWVSADGAAWTTAEIPPPTIPYEVAFNGQVFAAIGSNGYTLTSRDGVRWLPGETFAKLSFFALTAVDGQFIATATVLGSISDESFLVFSDNGEDWTVAPAPTLFAALAAADGRMLGMAGQGSIFDLVDPARPTPACEPPLADVSVYNPACQAVEDLFAAKIVQGRGTQGFVPEGQLSRAEFATMLVRAMGWTAPAGQTMSFSDLKESHWASGAIQAAVAHGAFSGFLDGTFKPDLPISRSELVKIAAAVAGLKPEGSAGYTDVASKDWFSGWVAAARTNGLLGPDAGGALWADPYFYGREAATRNEAALLLWNLMNRSK